MKLFLCCLFVLNLYSNDNIKLITETWTPYQILNGNELSGISVDIVKEIQKRVGNSNKIKVYPWSRGYNITLNKKGYALFLTTKTEKRKNLFKWVGPIANVDIVFFKNKKNNLLINNIEDAKKVKSIVVAKKSYQHQVLKKMGFNNLEVNEFANFSLIKLLNNKIDLYPTDYNTMLYKMKQEKINGLELVNLKKPIHESKLYIAFNNQTNKQIIKKWQKALDNIKKDGTYKKILDLYK